MNAPAETIALPVADVLRHATAEALAGEMLARVKNGSAAPTTATRSLPSIGAEWEGGLYAGLTIADGAPMALVLLPGDEKLTWSDAMAWTEKQAGALPSRIDQLVLFKNLKGQFQPEWYWSAEQYAGNDAYAWVQGFGDGGQDDGRKSTTHRARAVRRLSI